MPPIAIRPTTISTPLRTRFLTFDLEGRLISIMPARCTFPPPPYSTHVPASLQSCHERAGKAKVSGSLRFFCSRKSSRRPRLEEQSARGNNDWSFVGSTIPFLEKQI